MAEKLKAKFHLRALGVTKIFNTREESETERGVETEGGGWERHTWMKSVMEKHGMEQVPTTFCAIAGMIHSSGFTQASRSNHIF